MLLKLLRCLLNHIEVVVKLCFHFEQGLFHIFFDDSLNLTVLQSQGFVFDLKGVLWRGVKRSYIFYCCSPRFPDTRVEFL